MSENAPNQLPTRRQPVDPSRPPAERVGMLKALYERAVLTWRLLWDPRVGFWPKLIPVLGAAYIISPVDLLPAFLMGPLAPLGVTDDLGVALLVLNLFVQAAPPDVVSEMLRQMRGRPQDDDVVDGSAEWID